MIIVNIPTSGKLEELSHVAETCGSRQSKNETSFHRRVTLINDYLSPLDMNRDESKQFSSGLAFSVLTVCR